LITTTECWYVCDPTSFRLCATEDLVGRKTTVVFYQGAKRIHDWSFRSNLHDSGTQDKMDDLVGRLIVNFMSRNKKYVQEKLDFLAYNVYSQLKEVRTKLGKLIWRR